MIKRIEDNGVIFADIIRSTYNDCSNVFFTKPEDELQFGVLNYKAGYKTGAHFHNHQKNEKTSQVDEIIVLKEGSFRIDFFNKEGVYLKSCELSQGDILILYCGGHNISYLEKSKIYKFSPGAYIEEVDKTRMIGVSEFEIKNED